MHSNGWCEIRTCRRARKASRFVCLSTPTNHRIEQPTETTASLDAGGDAKDARLRSARTRSRTDASLRNVIVSIRFIVSALVLMTSIRYSCGTRIWRRSEQPQVLASYSVSDAGSWNESCSFQYQLVWFTCFRVSCDILSLHEIRKCGCVSHHYFLIRFVFAS